MKEDEKEIRAGDRVKGMENERREREMKKSE